PTPCRPTSATLCGFPPASSAATEITYSARSLSIPPLSGRLCIVLPPVLLRAEQRRARVLVESLSERLDGLALLVAQPHRHLHLDGDEQVAGLALAVALNTMASDTKHLARRRAGRDAHRHLAVERRHLHVGAEGGFRECHGEPQREVVAAATERGVPAHVHDDEEVAGRPTVGAGRTPSLHAD